MTGADVEFFQEGELFHGYRIQRLLGRGGNGAVYLARHEVLDNHYALKVLCPSANEQDATDVKRFLREARLATRVRHPNLVAVHDCGYDAGKNFYYLVMDYVSGSSLRSVLAFEGALSVERASNIVAQVVLALKAAQPFNMVHRDIKPENIMIQTDGRIKLVDLGIAKAQNLGDSVLTRTDSVFGTPSYVSPEQAISSANVDARADIYSLGVVFYEMLTGQCPYTGRNAAEILTHVLSDAPPPDVRSVRPDVPAEVADLVRRMMEKVADRRISSFDDLLDEIGFQENGQGTSADPGAEIAARPEVGMKTLLQNVCPTTLDGPVGRANQKKPSRALGFLRRVFGR